MTLKISQTQCSSFFEEFHLCFFFWAMTVILGAVNFLVGFLPSLVAFFLWCTICEKDCEFSPFCILVSKMEAGSVRSKLMGTLLRVVHGCRVWRLHKQESAVAQLLIQWTHKIFSSETNTAFWKTYMRKENKGD